MRSNDHRPLLMPVRRLVWVLLVAIAFTGADAIEMPDASRQLVPSDAHVLIAFASLDDVDHIWQRVVGALAAVDDDAELEDAPESVRELLAELAPDLMAYADASRPLLLAMTMAPPMAEEPVTFTLAVPVDEKALNPPLLRTLTGDHPSRVSGNYVGITTRAAYATETGASALALNLPDDALVARADLAGLIALYRPLAEMGLMAMAQAGAQAPSDSSGAAMPEMTPEMIASAQNLLRGLMDALQRLDLTLDEDGELTRMSSRLVTAPGGILDAGDQPDFATAMALTRFLPPHMPLVQASAMDVADVMENFADLYRNLATTSTKNLPAATAEAYANWVGDGIEMAESLGYPTATGFGAESDALRIYGVMSHPEAETALTELIDYYLRLNELEIGAKVVEQPPRSLAGVAVRSFEVEMDLEELDRIAQSDATAEADADEQAKIAEMLDRIYPTFWAAATPGHVLFCADPDAAAIGDLIQAVQSGRGSVRADLQAAADRAAPDTHSLIVGDLRQLAAAIFTWLSFLDEPPPPVPPGDPIPFILTQGVHDATWDGVLESDIAGIVQLVALLEEMGD